MVCQGDAVAFDDGVGMALPLASISALQAMAKSADVAGNPALYESLDWVGGRVRGFLFRTPE